MEYIQTPDANIYTSWGLTPKLNNDMGMQGHGNMSGGQSNHMNAKDKADNNQGHGSGNMQTMAGLGPANNMASAGNNQNGMPAVLSAMTNTQNMHDLTNLMRGKTIDAQSYDGMQHHQQSPRQMLKDSFRMLFNPLNGDAQNPSSLMDSIHDHAFVPGASQVQHQQQQSYVPTVPRMKSNGMKQSQELQGQQQQQQQQQNAMQFNIHESMLPLLMEDNQLVPDVVRNAAGASSPDLHMDPHLFAFPNTPGMTLGMNYAASTKQLNMNDMGGNMPAHQGIHLPNQQQQQQQQERMRNGNMDASVDSHMFMEMNPRSNYIANPNMDQAAYNNNNNINLSAAQLKKYQKQLQLQREQEKLLQEQLKQQGLDSLQMPNDGKSGPNAFLDVAALAARANHVTPSDLLQHDLSFQQYQSHMQMEQMQQQQQQQRQAQAIFRQQQQQQPQSQSQQRPSMSNNSGSGSGSGSGLNVMNQGMKRVKSVDNGAHAISNMAAAATAAAALRQTMKESSKRGLKRDPSSNALASMPDSKVANMDGSRGNYIHPLMDFNAQPQLARPSSAVPSYSNGPVPSKGRETTEERKEREQREKEEMIREFKRKTREAALIRFRQKRRERRFGKQVRYDCRKKLADSRPRVKGRFVRQEELAKMDGDCLQQEEEEEENNEHGELQGEHVEDGAHDHLSQFHTPQQILQN